MRFSIIFLIILLTACGTSGPDDVPDDIGPTTATGTITATGASLYRRGTHLLLMDERPRFFLESKSVNLSEYQNVQVVVRGELSLNTHKKYLPVINVASVEKIANADAASLQEYNVKSLALSLEAPSSWKSLLKEGRLTFTHKSEEQPFIAIETFDFVDVPEGIPVRIDGQNGVRVVDEESGVHRVYVRRGGSLVSLFTFGPKGDLSSGERDAFYTMLQSVKFDQISDEVVEEDVSGSGQPCGGSAGVICPEGEYCKITEIDTGIGICRGL